jgi:hypothetical protein
LLKIDVEGHEFQVLQGLDWSGGFRPENVILVIDRGGFHDAPQAMAFLRERGYTPCTVDGSPLDGESNPPEQNVWFQDSDRHPEL